MRNNICEINMNTLNSDIYQMGVEDSLAYHHSNFNPVLFPSTEVAGCFSQLSSGHLLPILFDHVHPLFSNQPFAFLPRLASSMYLCSSSPSILPSVTLQHITCKKFLVTLGITPPFYCIRFCKMTKSHSILTA